MKPNYAKEYLLIKHTGSAPRSSSSSSATPATSPPQPPVSDGPPLTTELSVLPVLSPLALVSTVHGRRLLFKRTITNKERWRGKVPSGREVGYSVIHIMRLSVESKQARWYVCRIENGCLLLQPLRFVHEVKSPCVDDNMFTW